MRSLFIRIRQQYKSAFETASIRKANKVIDRNGNFTSFNEPTTQYPNGYWTDTLGKPIGVPLRLNEPSQPTVQIYNMPRMSETIYHDEPNNYWVKSRSQIDVNKWAKSITY